MAIFFATVSLPCWHIIFLSLYLTLGSYLLTLLERFVLHYSSCRTLIDCPLYFLDYKNMKEIPISIWSHCTSDKTQILCHKRVNLRYKIEYIVKIIFLVIIDLRVLKYYTDNSWLN